MAEIKVLRTNGDSKALIEEGALQIFITSLENLQTADEHDYGDILLNDRYENRFALVAKESVNSKIITSALRLSILNLLKHMHENQISAKTLVVSRYQFFNSKEEIEFTSIFKEIIMLYFPEIEELLLVICDYK